MQVSFSEDPSEALAAAGAFLRARPVDNTVILSLLRSRIARPQPGRYVWVESDDDVCGFFMQSPVEFLAPITPMPREAVEALVAALDGVMVPGINGEAATAAVFAGAWASRRKVPARPADGMRLYSLDAFVPPAPVPGVLRPYREDDFPRVVQWTRAFADETGAPMPPTESDEASARDLIDSRRIWLWEVDGTVVCMVGAIAGAENVSRVGPVYTPPDQRGQGFAAACTGAVTQLLLDEGEHPVLFTQLENPTSNSVYQRLGYRAVSEFVRYSFE